MLFENCKNKINLKYMFFLKSFQIKLFSDLENKSKSLLATIFINMINPIIALIIMVEENKILILAF